MIDPKAVELVSAAAEIAGHLERGQAEQPLLNETRKIAGVANLTLELALVGLDVASKSAVIQFLIGPQHNSVKVRLTESVGLLEIRLQERGYSLSTESKEIEEFSQPEQFVTALEQSLKATGVATDSWNSVKLGLVAPPPLRNIGIAVLPALDVIIQQPRVVAALTAQPTLIAIAIPEGHAWAEADLEGLRVVCSSALAVWPIIVGGTGKIPDGSGQVLAAAGIFVLPPTMLSPTEGAFLPAFISGGPTNPVRSAISNAARAREVRKVIDMLRERFDSDRKQLRARAQREARLERHSEGGAREQTVRAEFDAIKGAVNEDFGQLVAAVKDANRRAVSRTGALMKSLRELAQSVHPGDLERTPGQKVVRLSIRQEVLAELRERFGKAVQRMVEEDCVLVRDSLELTRGRIEQGLARAGSRLRSVPLAAPDSRRMWEALHESVDIEVRYRGEIQKRGFLQRLGQGRQIVFSGLMILSLVGSFIGFNFRRAAAIGVVLLVVFIGAVIHTYRSWAREEEELIAREIEKVNEAVGAELDRLAADVARELDARLQALLDGARRDLLARLDALARETQAALGQAAETEKREARARIKLLEGREKEMQALALKMTKTAQLADAALDAAMARLRDVLKPAPAVAVQP